MSYTKFTTLKQLIGIAGNDSGMELITEIPITIGHPYSHQLVFQEVLTDVKAGDMLVAHADWECTTPYAYNLMVVTYISATETADHLLNPMIISEMNGRNIDLNIHHEQTARIGTLIADKDYSQLYVNFVVYVASTQATSGNKLQVEQGYGRLTIHHYR
jgi:hypothetical protein